MPSARSFPRRGFPALVLLLSLGVVPPADADRVTGFDGGLEGWRITGDNDAYWQEGGGNPGGCLNVNDLAVEGTNEASAPLSFLGDWSTLGTSDSLLIDYYFLNTSGGPVSPGPYNFRISGPGGVAEGGYGYVPVEGMWVTAAIPLDPVAWTLTSGTWAGLVEQVTSLRIVCEYVTGEEIVLLDNVRLTGDPVPVFSPCEHETFATAGLGDWSFENTGGVSNPGSGGNGGGFAQVVDELGPIPGHAFAPSRFLGDWSSFDGTGEVAIDIRLISYSGQVDGAIEFIRLSGPGGAAHVSLAPSEVPLGGGAWRTLHYPLSESGWTMTTGTWAGLLADVTECRIQTECIYGEETMGFDNFTRRLAGCPPVDDPVAVHVPDVTRCGYHSYVGISGVTLNPADGNLYGVVDRSTSLGGGVVAVTGDSAGIRLRSYANPSHLISDASGNLFVSDGVLGRIYRRTPSGGWSLWVTGFHSGDDDPAGMCFAPPGFSGPGVSPGDILVTDWGAGGPDEIWAFSPSVAEGERPVMPDPGDVDIQDITTGPDSVVFAADALDSTRVFRLTPAGSLVSIPLLQPVRGMSSVVYDDVTGRLYVTSSAGRSIHRIDPGSGAVHLVADGFAGIAFCNLELDSDGRRLWAADSTLNRVYEFCLAGGTAPVASAMPMPPRGTLISSLEVSPNPARSGTGIRFALARSASVRLDVYDVTGRLVREVAAHPLAAGSRMLWWDGCDGAGRRAADGMYILRVSARGESHAARALILR